MHFSTTTTAAAAAALLSLLAAQASAKTIKIDVGKDGLTFSPDSVTAAKGDVLEFHFYKQHSVAMGDFSKGCTPASQGGFYSGFVNVSGSGEDKDVFQVTVNNTNSVPFYCTVGKHCQAGMVGVVNPSSTDSLDKYRKECASASENKSPSGVFGGKMVDGSSNSGGSGSGSKTDSSQGPSTTTPGANKTGAASQMQSPLGAIAAVALGFAVFLI